MSRKKGKRIIHFYNDNSLDNAIAFLENIKKKITYLNLSVNVEGKDIKITLFGSRDLQNLAIERLKELAHQFL